MHNIFHDNLSNCLLDSDKEYVKLPEKFYPDLKDLLPNVKDIMNAKVLRLVINVIFNNFIEMEDSMYTFL